MEAAVGSGGRDLTSESAQHLGLSPTKILTQEEQTTIAASRTPQKDLGQTSTDPTQEHRE